MKQRKRLLLDDPSHLQFEINQLKSTVAGLSSIRGGAVYVRWGKTFCPSNGTETIYSGYAGGSHYTQTGAAAEYVCLPKDPIFEKQIPTAASSTGYIYGGEYETNYFGPAQDQDVPCVVCRSTTGTTALMIPARNQCYSGWKLEYHGKLASGDSDQAAATEFVCIDDQPEVITGGTADDNGKLFYSVRAKCGSLQCPPYKDNLELSCVVCTR